MKFCYIDESGCGEEPILVMAGIIVDSTRMHKTKKEWYELIQDLSNRLNKPIQEFKARKFYKGNGIWKELNGDERAEFIKTVIEWLGKKRKHDLAFSAVDKQKYNNLNWNEYPNITKFKSPWQVCALHLLLSIQKAHQSIPKNKGHTVCIFDENFQEKESLLNLVYETPSWTDTFYKKKENKERLDMIIDVPYWVDSKAVGLIQLADLYAYLLRRYAELRQGLNEKKYDDEPNKVRGWVNLFAEYTLKDSMRWPARGDDCARFFNAIAPDSLKNLVSESKKRRFNV